MIQWGELTFGSRGSHGIHIKGTGEFSTVLECARINRLLSFHQLLIEQAVVATA
ncbi:Uncharacterised protein [Vibrio cholerae]|nr:Uncharacterised protein [Vibrio cholerae]